MKIRRPYLLVLLSAMALSGCLAGNLFSLLALAIFAAFSLAACGSSDDLDMDGGAKKTDGSTGNKDGIGPAPLYGVPNLTDSGQLKGDACIPGGTALYGPQQCSADADCISQYGANWYCDKTNGYDNGCGGKTSWPICKQK